MAGYEDWLLPAAHGVTFHGHAEVPAFSFKQGPLKEETRNHRWGMDMLAYWARPRVYRDRVVEALRKDLEEGLQGEEQSANPYTDHYRLYSAAGMRRAIEDDDLELQQLFKESFLASLRLDLEGYDVRTGQVILPGDRVKWVYSEARGVAVRVALGELTNRDRRRLEDDEKKGGRLVHRWWHRPYNASSKAILDLCRAGHLGPWEERGSEEEGSRGFVYPLCTRPLPPLLSPMSVQRGPRGFIAWCPELHGHRQAPQWAAWSIDGSVGAIRAAQGGGPIPADPPFRRLQ